MQQNETRRAQSDGIRSNGRLHSVVCRCNADMSSWELFNSGVVSESTLINAVLGVSI
jgi:hypothetical protein